MDSENKEFNREGKKAKKSRGMYDFFQDDSEYAEEFLFQKLNAFLRK